MPVGFYKRIKPAWNKGLRGPRGSDNGMWKGDRIGYDAIHSWLRTYFGKADHCENKTCPGTSNYFNWALKKGKRYERKRTNFFQLCLSCHWHYDDTPERHRKQAASLRGFKHSQETLEKMSKARIGKKKSKEVRLNMSKAQKLRRYVESNQS